MLQSPRTALAVPQDIPEFSALVRTALRALWRNLPVLVLATALCGGLAALYARSQPPFYAASSAILIDPRLGSGGVDGNPAPTIFLADALVVDSEIQVMMSDRLLRRVVRKLDERKMLLTDVEMVDAGGVPVSDAQREDMWVEWLRSGLLIERQGNTFVIVIGFTATTPELAAAVANLIAEEYVASQQDDTLSRVKQATTWLSSEMQRLTGEARTAEAAVQDFLVRNDVPRDGQLGLVGAQIGDVEREIVERQRELRGVETRLQQIETDLARIESGQTVGELLSMDASTPTLVPLMQQLKEAQTQALLLGGQRRSGQNQVVDRLTQQLRSELQSIRESRQASMEVTKSDLAKLTEQLASLKDEATKISAAQIELGTLQREADAVEQQQRRVLERLQQSQSQDLFIVSNTRIIDDAVPPILPANPPVLRSTLIGAIAGLFLGIAAVFLRAQTDDRIRNSRDIAQVLGLAYLGPVPRWRGSAENRRLLAAGAVPDRARHGGLLIYDSLRQAAVVLRTEPGVTLITSIGPDRTRAAFAAMLAGFIADSGDRVLLIDGDARERGLSQLIHGAARGTAGDTAEAGPGGLAVEAVGERLTRATLPLALDPSRLTRAIAELLAERATLAEIVIIDGPSLATAVEEIIAAARVEKALLTLPFGRVSGSFLRQVLEQRPAVAARLRGVALTDAGAARMLRNDPLLNTGRGRS